MLEPDGYCQTRPLDQPVPAIVTDPGIELREGGVLADVAADRALDLLDIPQPEAMTGKKPLRASGAS